MRELTRGTLVKYAEKRRAAGLSNKTINLDLQGLRSALRLAKRAGRVLRLPEFPENLRERVRTGFPDPSEPELLAAHSPAWLAEMVRFAYATGWRRGELLSLRWEWVDWDEQEIRLPDSKNDEGRVVPIAGELVPIMERLRESRTVSGLTGKAAVRLRKLKAMEADRAAAPNEKAQARRLMGKILDSRPIAVLAETVFHDSGQAITRKRFVRAWNAARKAANLQLRLFHDFRRAAARRMTNAGVAQVVAMRVTGHKTPSMFRRYSIVETADLARALRQVASRKEKASGRVVALHSKSKR